MAINWESVVSNNVRSATKSGRSGSRVSLTDGRKYRDLYSSLSNGDELALPASLFRCQPKSALATLRRWFEPGVSDKNSDSCQYHDGIVGLCLEYSGTTSRPDTFYLHFSNLHPESLEPVFQLVNDEDAEDDYDTGIADLEQDEIDMAISSTGDSIDEDE